MSTEKKGDIRRLGTWFWLVTEAVVWWALCLGVWVLTLSAVSGAELAVAAPVALGCGVLVVAARRVEGSTWRFRLSWVVPALVLPAVVVTDTAAVIAAAVTRRPGRFVDVEVAQGAGGSARARGRRALVTVVVSLSPGSIVADISEESGSATLHLLSERGPRMDRLATR